MTKETILKNKILIEAGKRGFKCLRLNSGRAWNGKMIRVKYLNNIVNAIVNPRPIALCPEGTSDLLFIMPDGKYCFVETKVKPYKPTETQLNFIQQIIQYGGKAGVVYSLQEFIDLIK